MPPLGVGRWRIEKGDGLRLFLRASVASTSFVWARIYYDDGSSGELNIPDFVSTSDRVPYFVDSPGNLRARMGGWIVGGMWDLRTVAPKRGQLYGEVTIFSGGDIKDMVCKGYLYNYNGVPFGQYTEDGPGGGEGYLSWVTLASDVAGNVDTTPALATTNTFRRVHGFVWFYNASADAASRTLETRLGRPSSGAFPTGFVGAGGNLIWDHNPGATDLTLTAGQEGIIYAMGNYATTYLVSTAALTARNTTTAPTPFPYDVTEDDLSAWLLTIGSGNANDRYSAYALVEEWLVV